MTAPTPPTTFTETPEYVLRRDYAASARLNLQHYQHKQCLGYLLHPFISLKAGMHIADVATGSGIWLLDLASEVPEDCVLEGWDISDAQFAHESSLPDNVRFGVFDATKVEEVVEKGLVERYDVIHVGLLALVVKDGEPGIWIENLMKMLKPGGYLQWMEGDMPRYITRIRTSGSSPSKYPHMHALEQLHVSQMSGLASSGAIQWITDLGKHFEKQGLQNVKSIPYNVAKKYWRGWTETLLLILEEMADQLNQPMLKKMIGDAGAELVLGAVNPTLMPLVVVGQKPL